MHPWTLFGVLYGSLLQQRASQSHQSEGENHVVVMSARRAPVAQGRARDPEEAVQRRSIVSVTTCQSLGQQIAFLCLPPWRFLQDLQTWVDDLTSFLLQLHQ